MKRIRVKIGDVFSARMDEQKKRYFQFIARDNTQLGSDVIRVFHKTYLIDESPDLNEITKDDVETYVHVLIHLGLQLDCWEKIGHVSDVGDPDILFRDTNEYGGKVGEEPVKVSKKWWVWRVNEEQKYIGKLKGKYRNSYVGIVINPKGVLELLRGNKYPPFYPDFE